MKITKTTLLFIATLFFLALPLMFTNGSAQAAYPGYNWTGAEHNADGGWTMPADNGTCVGANASTPSDSIAQDLGVAGEMENCSTVQPAWVAADFATQTACEGAGYFWGGNCTFTQTQCTAAGYTWDATKSTCNVTGHFHSATECSTGGGTWVPTGPCANHWYDDTSAAYTAGTSAHECLYCHDGGHGYNMSGYLKSAHANATRPTVDHYAWVTPIEEGSTAYTLSSGYAIDWATDTLDMGTCSVGTSTTATDCTAAGGTWTANPTPMYWMFGSWLEGAANSARIIHSGQTSGAAWVGCNRCHSTGFEADATANTANLLPYRDSAYGAGFSLAGGNVSASNFNGTTQNWAGWQQWGITCSRCHNAMNGGHANTGTGTTQLNGLGFPATNLDTGDFSPLSGATGAAAESASAEQLVVCYQCHYQNDGKDLRDSQVTYPGMQLVASGEGIERHANGFLNSPHAMFTGTYGQLADTSQYLSHFTSSDGTCAGCHNVHESVTDDAAGEPVWNGQCGVTCHSQSPSDPYNKMLTHINHPDGPGTPLADATTTNPTPACQTCHMPGGIHLFRINADPTYRLNNGGTYVNTIPDPSNNNFPSAYVDLNMACGQCHGGDAGASGIQNGAPYMTVDELAQYAAIMHSGSGTSTIATGGKYFSWYPDSTNPYMVDFVVNGAACTEGGCTYSWDFGDGIGTGSGPTFNYQYANTVGTVQVTLTINNGSGNIVSSQVVTPTGVHSGPTCTGQTIVDSTTVPAATPVGPGNSITGSIADTITLNLGSTTGTDTTPGVYVNWGDGSPMSTPALTAGTITHTYSNANFERGYTVTEILQDNEGYNCEKQFNVKIGSTTVSSNSINIDASLTGGAWTTNADCTGFENPAPCCGYDPATQTGENTCTVDSNADCTGLYAPYGCCTGAGTGTCGYISYIVSDANSGITEQTGAVALGTPLFATDSTLPALAAGDSYTVTFYYPTGHTCTPTSATTLSHGSDTNIAINATAPVSNCH